MHGLLNKLVSVLFFFVNFFHSLLYSSLSFLMLKENMQLRNDYGRLLGIQEEGGSNLCKFLYVLTFEMMGNETI
jgi:hypothetical protein